MLNFAGQMCTRDILLGRTRLTAGILSLPLCMHCPHMPTVLPYPAMAQISHLFVAHPVARDDIWR